MEINQERLQQLLDGVVPGVVETFKKELSATVEREALKVASELVRKEVTTWMQENLLPEVVKSLNESRDGLLALVPKVSAGITEQLCEKMLTDLSENLKNSWQRQRIYEALFK